MSKPKLADLADKLGPQTMSSRIGKMPMVIAKTLLGPMMYNSPSQKSMDKIETPQFNENPEGAPLSPSGGFSIDPYMMSSKTRFGSGFGPSSSQRANPYRARNDSLLDHRKQNVMAMYDKARQLYGATSNGLQQSQEPLFN